MSILFESSEINGMNCGIGLSGRPFICEPDLIARWQSGRKQFIDKLAVP